MSQIILTSLAPLNQWPMISLETSVAFLQGSRFQLGCWSTCNATNSFKTTTVGYTRSECASPLMDWWMLPEGGLFFLRTADSRLPRGHLTVHVDDLQVTAPQSVLQQLEGQLTKFGKLKHEKDRLEHCGVMHEVERSALLRMLCTRTST
eukprot:3830292-Amphidinium_carterae.1